MYEASGRLQAALIDSVRAPEKQESRMFCLFWKPTWYIWKWLPHALPLLKSSHNYPGTVHCELGGLWEISDVFLMLAEPLLDKFCIVFCVSFIVKHHVAIWEEKQHGRGAAGEWQWPNKHWQAPAIRWDKRDGRLPTPTIPHRWSIFHTSLLSYLHSNSWQFFIQRLKLSKSQVLGFPCSVLEELDRSIRCPTNWISLLGRTTDFLKQWVSFWYLNRKPPLKNERIPRALPSFSTSLMALILAITQTMSEFVALKPLNNLKAICMIVHFSSLVMTNSLQPHGLRHARLPCLSPTLGAYSNSCPLSQVMQSNHLIFYCPLLLPPSIFPSIRVFSNELVLCIKWPKYWSFSFMYDKPT